MPPATSDRHLSKYEKTTDNAASDGFVSNFSGAAFCLAPPIDGLLVRLNAVRRSAFYYRVLLPALLLLVVVVVVVVCPSQKERLEYLEKCLT